jgi:predicted nucleic acid-binding protein
LTFYADTSLLVSALSPDANTARARDWLKTGPGLIISAWAVAEFGAIIRRQARVGRIARAGVDAAEAGLQTLVAGGAFRPVLADDLVEAGRLVRRLEPLRAPDALHLAVALRLRLDVATFDVGLATAARAAGLGAAPL